MIETDSKVCYWRNQFVAKSTEIYFADYVVSKGIISTNEDLQVRLSRYMINCNNQKMQQNIACKLQKTTVKIISIMTKSEIKSILNYAYW